MNVKELTDLLSHFDGETEVILAKDGEGNGFRMLSNYSYPRATFAREETTYDSFIRDIELYDQDEYCQHGCDGSDHEPNLCQKAPTDAVPVVVLWPNY